MRSSLAHPQSCELSGPIVPFAGPPSSPMKFPLRMSLWFWPLLAGVLASLIYGLQHRTGIELNADGWAYWQGAQSIADGLGYRYFSGDPINAWPPLYSLYLSTWIKLCGSEASVLILANIALVFTQGLLWTFLFYTLFADEQERDTIGYAAIYLALTIPNYERSVLAHNLFYTLLPIFIFASWKAITDRQQRGRLYVVLTCCFGIALVESHFSGVAYVAAAAFLFAIFPEHGRRNGIADALTVLAVPLTASILTAWRLGQIGGHPIEGGRFSFIQTLLQISDGIGYFVLPHLGSVFGLTTSIVIFGTLSRSFEPRSNRITFVLVFSLLSLSLLAIAFSITWLNGFVSESRHLLIVPLLVIPILVSYFMSSKVVIMKTAALLVFLVPVSRTLFLNDTLTSNDFIPNYASISPVPGFGKTIDVNGKILVGPIPWEEPEGGYSSSGAPQWGLSQTPAPFVRDKLAP